MCALQEEAKAQQQQPASGGKKGGKEGKGNQKKAYKPTPCMQCKKPCKTPVGQLLLDVTTMKQMGGGHAAVRRVRGRRRDQMLH